VFGTSKDVSLGPTAVLCLLIADATDGDVQLAISLCFMIGMVQLFMGLFRLGAFVDFISHPVLSGFTSASAIIIG
jgi:MFS superfamily sulfate permease-like transporter